MYVPYQFCIQSSCFVTLLLSATRMTALMNPLHIIKKRSVSCFLLISSVFLLCMAVGKFLLLNHIQDENYSDEAILKGIKLFLKRAHDVRVEFANGYKTLFYMQMTEFAVIAVIVMTVAVCCGITVKSLNSPMAEVSMESGDGRGNSHNRRATIMILLLSFVFVLFNGSWVATILMLNIEVIERVEQAKVAEMTFITLFLMPANSVVNPLIYINRNSALKEYTRSSVMRLRRCIFRYRN